MPFGVRQWPGPCDPRTPSFAIVGYEKGKVPPWAFTVATTAATGTMALFNAGVLVKSVVGLLDQAVYIDDGSHGIVTATVVTNGFTLPVTIPPPPQTMFITIIIRESGVATWTGLLGKLYPDAISVHQPVVMQNVAPSGGTIPAPMSLTPRPFDAT